jgi:hypothetical protein
MRFRSRLTQIAMAACALVIACSLSFSQTTPSTIMKKPTAAKKDTSSSASTAPKHEPIDPQFRNKGTADDHPRDR